jgi:hypothetical protein
MISKLKPPTASDPKLQRTIQTVYDDINSIVDTINRGRDVGQGESAGHVGSLRLSRMDSKDKRLEVRFADGWHRINARVLPIDNKESIEGVWGVRGKNLSGIFVDGVYEKNMSGVVELSLDPTVVSYEGHNHDGVYAPLVHYHDDRYSLLGHTHDDRYSLLGHLHDDRYSQLGHLHDDRYGQLAAANTWTLANTFQLAVVVPNAALDTHAVNRGYGNTLWVPLSRVVTAGDGLTGGGNLTTDRILTLGTPGTLSEGSVNGVTADSHTHAITNYALGGTANQVNVAGAGRLLGSAVTLSLPQDIHTLATPRFARLGLGQAAHATYSLDAIGAVNASEYRVGTILTIDSYRHASIISAQGDGFASGWAGSSWRITSGAEMELTNLRVRGRLNVYELLINQIRATNGSLFVSSAGRVATVTDLGGWFYALTFEDDIVPFAQDDLLRSQRFTGSGVYQSNVSVYSIAGNIVEVYRESGDVPVVGMDYVRLGNFTAAARQGTIYLSSDDSDAPYIDVVDGVGNFAAWNAAGSIKTRVGKLTGITAQANEYGIMAGSNGYGIYDKWFKVSTHGAQLNNVDLKMYSGGVQYAEITQAGGFLGSTDRFSWNAAAVTVSGWELEAGRITKTIAPVASKKFSVNLRADEAAGHAGLQILQEEDPTSSSNRNHMTVGRIMSTAYGWTNRWGFAYLYRSGSTAERRLFEISIDTNGNRLAQIAGWDFDYNKLWTGTGSDFVGMQQRVNSSTRVFFAGATDNAGADAVFYVQANGDIFHPSILIPIFMGTRHAGGAAGDYTTTSVSFSSNSTSSLLKAAGNFIKRFGTKRLIVRARGSVEMSPAIGQMTLNVINDHTGSTVISNTSVTWNTVAPSTQQVSLDLDISSLDDNTIYRVLMYIRRSYGSGNVFMREPNIFASSSPI